MRKIQLTFAILFFFTCLQVFSQEKENKLFLKAYKYLKNNNLKSYDKLSIADSVIFIEYTLCFDTLKKESNNERNLIDSLDKIDREREFKAYFTSVGKIHENAKAILFFSKPYKRTLLVEMFDSPQAIANDYKKLTKYGSSTLFLIHFNRCKKVKKCASSPIAYN